MKIARQDRAHASLLLTEGRGASLKFVTQAKLVIYYFLVLESKVGSLTDGLACVVKEAY